MSYHGDVHLEDSINVKFNTVQFSTGAAFAFASGAVEIYEDGSLTQITGAETLTLEFDGVTGLHNLLIACTAANGFEAGKDYSAVVSAGTVDSVSAVGAVVANFSVNHRAPNDPANKTDTDANAAVTDALVAAVPTASEINAEVVDVLKTDTTALPSQEAPPLTPTMEEMISWLYKTLRNRTTQTATSWSLYADDETTVDAKATVSDNGTTAVKQEIVTGP